MAKNKYDFIKELLENKKINQNQRERILELTSKEISVEGSLEERVQQIEEIIFNQKKETNNLKVKTSAKGPSKSEDISLRKYIGPILFIQIPF